MNLHMQLIRGCTALLVIIGLAAAAAWAPVETCPHASRTLARQPLQSAGADRSPSNVIETSQISDPDSCAVDTPPTGLTTQLRTPYRGIENPVCGARVNIML